jgi:hypothetical protein
MTVLETHISNFMSFGGTQDAADRLADGNETEKSWPSQEARPRSARQG